MMHSLPHVTEIFIDTADMTRIQSFDVHRKSLVNPEVAPIRNGDHIPELVVTREDEMLLLKWDTPEGYKMSLPIEVEIDGQRQVVTFEEGRGILPAHSDATVIVDPDRWILRSRMH